MGATASILVGQPIPEGDRVRMEFELDMRVYAYDPNFSRARLTVPDNRTEDAAEWLKTNGYTEATLV